MNTNTMQVGEEEESLGCNGAGTRVSLFDYSVENHFNAMNTISKLCGETETAPPDESEIRRLSSSITFLREWRHFCYEPRVIRFARQSDRSQEKDILSGINLPQFSSATVPKKDKPQGTSASLDYSTDFVMYVGGSVWALDWCPRVHEKPNCSFKREFVAVATHPPESYYHRIGAPLSGRGVIQIWCVINANGSEEELRAPMKRGKPVAQFTEGKRPRGRPRKISQDNEATKEISTRIVRPRGRPRKKPTIESVDCSTQQSQTLSVQYPNVSSGLVVFEEASGNASEPATQKDKGKKRKKSTEEVSASNSSPKATVRGRRLKSIARARASRDNSVCPPLLTYNENEESLLLNPQADENPGEDHALDSTSFDDNVAASADSVAASADNVATSAAPEDVMLPRLVLCLAHNGKVAWDAKWRPPNALDSESQHRMGYLAVLLGNGSLEVWDVPLPQTMGLIYSASCAEGTDPRFVKLEPVFRCSILKCGDMTSIPLTVEWSTSQPHDYLLVGSHDGLVALWKFSTNGTCRDTRPLLCFSADTVPIRAVAWAPVDSDQQSANVILTAGHAGLKFWDIRDPFRPLWDLHPSPKLIYSLDWLPDPRCIIVSFDDGTMRLLSLVKAAYDAPVNGEPTVGPKQLGMHVFNYSSSAIWSVQVSRLTGMVAYSSADGTVCRFQLTTKAVEKDPSRYRSPHFMCGSLSEDESAITINSPLPDIPLTLKRSVNDIGDDKKSNANQVRRTNDKKAKGPASGDQPLALCYGDDPGVESESDQTLATFRSKSKSKCKSSTKTKAGDDQALVCREEKDKVHEKESGNGIAGNKIEVISSKTVAMHRVRWNMNKGSERWLCYGGSAGIVRCQEITMSGTR